MSSPTPWAVLLCKFKDDDAEFKKIDIDTVHSMFTALDRESVFAFWRDVSFGMLDFSGFLASDWLTLDHNQQDYLGSGANQSGRDDLVTWATDAAGKAGVDLAGYSGVAIYMSTKTDMWGGTGRMVVDPFSPMAGVLQELGHGLGQTNHSRAVTPPIADYTDPFCVMSAMNFGYPTINDDILNRPFFSGEFGETGPLMCSPYVDSRGWLTPSRQVSLATDGSRPQPTAVLRISPLGAQSPSHPQVATLDLDTPSKTKFYFEFRSGGWDRGMAQKQVVIHQFRPDGYAYYAGNIPVSTGSRNGATLQPQHRWTDPTFDLSVLVGQLPDANDDSVEIMVGPRVLAQPMSVRAIAREKFSLIGRIAVRHQVPPVGEQSLLARLGSAT
jgi:hypothetical protein